MGQAALKYDEFDELDQVPIPEGGIATFLTAETGSWADDDDDVPPKGITNVVKIADKLAEYGRNEDEYMVHAAEGETVIPMEVFKQNPALKDKLFAEMRIMGIEPERYVVGNELNSINPVTGQPEFFLKKLFRGLKKVVKKVLPVVAKAVLTVVTGNPVLASAIVDGATAVIQGGSLKDGLKAAAIGGISSFAAGKLGNKFNWAKSTAGRLGAEAAISTTLRGGKPEDILKAAALSAAVGKGTDIIGLTGPTELEATPQVDATAQVDAKLGDALSTDLPVMDAALEASGAVPTPGETVITTEFLSPGEPVVADAADAASGVVATATPVDVVDATSPQVTGIRLPGAPPPVDASLELFPGAQQVVSDVDTALAAGAEDPLLRSYRREAGLAADPRTTVTPDVTPDIDAPTLESLQVPGVSESVKDIFTGIKGPDGQPVGMFGGRVEALKNLFLPRGQVDTGAVREFLKAEGEPFDSGAIQDFIKNDLKLGTFRTFGPGAAAVLGLSALGQQEMDPVDISDRRTGLDLIRENPEAYRIFDDDRTYTPPRFTVTRAAGADLGAPAFQPTPISTPPFGFDEGGEIMNFPRMNGPIEGPGTETSDDIPAMLSDGEFVFTAKAVRGAGRGSREDGMKNMYNMMRQFEARV
jgi:hypothetical protein